MSRSVVEFHDVSKRFVSPWRAGHGLLALDRVSFAIEPGEVFGLLGPNRAGKTTLVKTLLSICRPTGGRVVRLGAPWSDRSTLARIGYVHESQAFPRYLTATQLLEYYGALTGIAADPLRRRCGELIEMVGLADRAHESIARFSKGMLQRLALAQALLNDPELLVLDEPSEGMDLCARRLLHETIRERRRKGYTVLLVSHALSDVERLCDRVAVLREGRTVFVGSLKELSGAELAHAAVKDDEAALSLETALEPYYEEALA